MKKFYCLVLCMCLVLCGCGTDVSTTEPKSETEVEVIAEELDFSAYVGKSITIEPKACYVDISYDAFNMIVGSKDSVVYMKTSVGDFSSAFWFDYNTETIYFEDNSSGDVVLSKGSVESDSVEDTTGTEFGSFVITNITNAVFEDDYISVTGDIDMDGTVYNNAIITLYKDNTFRSLYIKDEESEINVYSLVSDSSLLPAIPEGDFKELTTEEAEENLFTTMMLLMAGAVNSVDTSTPEETVDRVIEVNVEGLENDIVESMCSTLENSDYKTTFDFYNDTVSVYVDDSRCETALSEIESMFGNATLTDSCYFNIILKYPDTSIPLDIEFSLAEERGGGGSSSSGYYDMQFQCNNYTDLENVINTTKAELVDLGYELYYGSDLSETYSEEVEYFSTY